jgi:prevent-host-death family protein
MKTVSIRELHAKTGELVRQAVYQGQILVTDRGRVVARIIPEKDGDRIPFFRDRRPSAEFQLLDDSGRTARGTDVTVLISEDREDRV